MQINADHSYELTVDEQIIVDYLVPDDKYQSILVEIQIDTHRQNETITIPDLRDRFIKTVLILHDFTPEESSVFIRRTSKRFNSLVSWIQSAGHLVPDDTKFPFTEDE